MLRLVLGWTGERGGGVVSLKKKTRVTGTELESSWTWVLDPVVQFKGGVGTCFGGKRAVVYRLCQDNL